MSMFLFSANILLRIVAYIRFPSHKVHGVDAHILFLETALVSVCIYLK